MSEAKKVPPLRFKGFDGGWEKKRLEAIVTFSKGKGYSKSDITEEGCPLFLYGRMYTNYQVEVTSVETFCKLRDGSVLSKGGEVVCPASGETAEDIACASAVVEKGIVLGGDLNILTPRKDADIDSVFLALSLTYGTPRNVIKSRAQGKTVVHIHNLDFADIGVFNPPLPEQQKLGEVFRSIDTLIASRETALEKLKAFKKAMLEKMFPRAGAKVPEVRFKGFDGEWRSYEFSEVYERINAKSYQVQSSEYLQTGDFPVVDQGKDLIIAYSNNEDKVFRAAESPVIVFGDHTREVKFVDFDFVIGADGTQLLRSANFDVRFAYYVMKRVTLPNMGYSRHFKFLLETRYSFPSLPEQRKIGVYFRSLDALISARRDEIAKLKDLKKALLDRMFV